MRKIAKKKKTNQADITELLLNLKRELFVPISEISDKLEDLTLNDLYDEENSVEHIKEALNSCGGKAVALKILTDMITDIDDIVEDDPIYAGLAKITFENNISFDDLYEVASNMDDEEEPEDYMISAIREMSNDLTPEEIRECFDRVMNNMSKKRK